MVSCMRQRNMIIQRKIDFHICILVDQRSNAAGNRSAVTRNPCTGSCCREYEEVQKISKDLQQKFGREATPEEIAAEMKDKSPEFVKEILSYLQNPVSLETPVGEDGENNLGDMVEDKDATTPEDAMNQLVQKEEVQELLESLNDRERQVIRLRFGLEDGKTHTLEEIGDELNVTRERVRQIEARAMEKLRSKATKL